MNAAHKTCQQNTSHLVLTRTILITTVLLMTMSQNIILQNLNAFSMSTLQFLSNLDHRLRRSSCDEWAMSQCRMNRSTWRMHTSHRVHLVQIWNLDDFLHVMETFSSKDTSLVKFSWTSDHLFPEIWAKVRKGRLAMLSNSVEA